jgi:hypothetical protein
MLKLYSLGDMESYVRGDKIDSLSDRVSELREFPIELNMVGITEECNFVRKDFRLINDFGEGGNEYVLDRSDLKGLNFSTDTGRYLLDDRGHTSSFSTMGVSGTSHLGEEAIDVMRRLLELHQFYPDSTDILKLPHKILLHQHRIEDTANNVAYNFYLPSKSEIKSLEHRALVMS